MYSCVASSSPKRSVCSHHKSHSSWGEKGYDIFNIADDVPPQEVFVDFIPSNWERPTENMTFVVFAPPIAKEHAGKRGDFVSDIRQGKSISYKSTRPSY